MGSNDASVASLAAAGRCGCVLASALGMRHSSCFARACGSFTTERFAAIPFRAVDPDKPGVARARASAAICASRAAAALSDSRRSTAVLVRETPQLLPTSSRSETGARARRVSALRPAAAHRALAVDTLAARRPRGCASSSSPAPESDRGAAGARSIASARAPAPGPGAESSAATTSDRGEAATVTSGARGRAWRMEGTTCGARFHCVVNTAGASGGGGDGGGAAEPARARAVVPPVQLHLETPHVGLVRAAQQLQAPHDPRAWAVRPGTTPSAPRST